MLRTVHRCLCTQRANHLLLPFCACMLQVRAVFKKHAASLKALYKGFSAVGTELITHLTAREKFGGDDGMRLRDDESALDLKEMLLMFAEAHLLEEQGSCSARTLTAFFVQVNIDDDMRGGDAGGDAGGATGGGTGNGKVARAGCEGGGAAAGASRAPDAAPDAAQVEFDEFLEVIARVCDVVVPEPRTEPFHETLSSWLSLIFLPAMRAAAKARHIKIA